MTVSDAATGASVRPRCFFDISVGGLQLGRLVFELFNDKVPKTVENFRMLCTGDKGNGIVTDKPLHYKNVIFHRVVKDFMIQAGDFSAGNGTGGESIYGGTFEDESFEMKHDRPFLLSMANRGKNTNGSQFFITTQPAPHLDNIHVVFGRVISGQELVRQLEELPIDRNSRPLQDATITNCGELVRQLKVKKEKKKKKHTASSDENSHDDSEVEKRSKRKEKKKKKDRKRSKSEEENSPDEDGEEDKNGEDGELSEEGELHPLASVTKIDPDEIPEVSNKFLMRGERSNRSHDKDVPKREERGHDNRNTFGWSKRRVPTSRSGRNIKGRGVFRFRTPSRSRSRSTTPPHWKRAQNRTIKLSDLERLEEEKKMREEEIKRREVERKKRHEEMAKDPKKSFFELSHASSYGGRADADEVPVKVVDKRKRSDSDRDILRVERERKDDKQNPKVDRDRSEEKKNMPKRKKSMDMNALDYEHQVESEEDDAAANQVAAEEKRRVTKEREKATRDVKKSSEVEKNKPAKEKELAAVRRREERSVEKASEEKQQTSRRDHKSVENEKAIVVKEKPQKAARQQPEPNIEKAKPVDKEKRQVIERRSKEKSRQSREPSRASTRSSPSKSRSRSRSRSRSPSWRRRHTPVRDRRIMPMRRQGGGGGGGGGGGNGGGGFRSPQRRNFRGRRGGNPFIDRRRRSRSGDSYRNRYPLSPIRRRASPAMKRRSRSRDRSPSRSPRRDRRWARGGGVGGDGGRGGNGGGRRQSRSRSNSRHSRSATRSPSRPPRRNNRSRSRSNKSNEQRERLSKDRGMPVKLEKCTDQSGSTAASTTNTAAASLANIKTEDDKEKSAREKMQKRAEALLMFKEHMRKEIAKEEEKRVAEKKRLEDIEKANAARELEDLERLKRETLQKLEEHEKLKKTVDVIAAVAAVTSAVKEANKADKGSREKKKKHKKSKKHAHNSDSESN